MSSSFIFGLKNDNLVHISNVERGLACGCVCPICHKELQAHKGNERDHYFRHYHDDISMLCPKYKETVVHRIAKEIIFKNKKLTFPSLTYSVNNEEIKLFDINKVTFDDVLIENQYESIRPDLICYKNDNPYAIEIKVTNEVNENKKGIIDKLKLTTLEIDLSGFVNEDFSDNLYHQIEDYLVNKDYNKKFLFFNLNNLEKEEIFDVLFKNVELKSQKLKELENKNEELKMKLIDVNKEKDNLYNRMMQENNEHVNYLSSEIKTLREENAKLRMELISANNLNKLSDSDFKKLKTEVINVVKEKFMLNTPSEKFYHDNYKRLMNKQMAEVIHAIKYSGRQEIINILNEYSIFSLLI